LWKPGQSGNPATQFKPGVSGNPGGKPKEIRDLVDAARGLTGISLDRLEHLVNHAKDERLQFDAATEILNRGWGRPPQAVAVVAQVTTNAGGVDRPPTIDETPAEWLQRRRTELAAIEAEGENKH
jgi:hypothetical protein